MYVTRVHNPVWEKDTVKEGCLWVAGSFVGLLGWSWKKSIPGRPPIPWSRTVLLHSVHKLVKNETFRKRFLHRVAMLRGITRNLCGMLEWISDPIHYLKSHMIGDCALIFLDLLIKYSRIAIKGRECNQHFRVLTKEQYDEHSWERLLCGLKRIAGSTRDFIELLWTT